MLEIRQHLSVNVMLTKQLVENRSTKSNRAQLQLTFNSYRVEESVWIDEVSK